MAIKNNKKGLGYFTLIGPIVLILLIEMFFLVSMPETKTATEIDFNKTITAIDLINAQIPAETFYKKEETKRSIEKSKKTFSQTLGLTESELLKRAGGDENELLGCKFENIQLWYNEKNVDFNNLQEKIDKTIGETNTDTTTTDDSENTNDNSKTQTSTRNKQTYTNCLPSFDEKFDEKFTLFVEDRLEKEIIAGLKAQNTQKDPIVNLTYDKEKNDIETHITTYYEKESTIAKISLNIDYQANQEMGKYPTLLTTLSSIIPKLPEAIKEEVAPCIKQEDKTELICIQETFIKQIQTTSPELLNYYDFKLDFIETKSKEYYGLQIKTIRKSSNQEELNFGIILKDNIPYSLINFQLQTFTGLDNIVELTIEKPRFADSVASYVILYSYDNFLNPSYKGYSEIVSLLNNNQIPTNFKKTGFTDSYKNQYFYSDSQSNLELSLITTSDKTYEENTITNKKEKKIKIYQIYDKESEEYKLLENKPLYVYAFATDENLNYYVQELESKAKSVTPETFFGPYPIPLNEKNNIAGTETNYQNTIFFKIGNYTDEKFDHFDLYIIEQGGSFTPFCEPATTTCHYFNGKSILTATKNIVFTVSSDIKESKDDNLFAFIEASRFTNNLRIENDKKYDVYIIPMDQANRGVLNTQKTEWNIVKNNANDLTYYILEQGKETALQTPTKVTGLLVQDKKGPHPTQSYNILGTRVENNNLILDWEKIDNDIINLQATLIIYDINGIPTTPSTISISPTLKLVTPYNELTMSKVEIKEIIPIDGYLKNPANIGFYKSQYTNELRSVSYP